jgi:hypothetical protein
MKLRSSLLVCGILLAGTALPAAGQGPGYRSGFWWSVGFSYGTASVSCDICTDGRGGGLSLSGVAGGTLSPSFRLGMEADGWRQSNEGLNEYMGVLSAVIYWYPQVSGGLYLKGGAGYVAYRISDEDDELKSSGFGPQIGIGYETRVWGHASIQPFLSAIITIPTGQLELNGDRQADNVNLSLLQVGLSVTWH